VNSPLFVLDGPRASILVLGAALAAAAGLATANLIGRRRGRGSAAAAVQARGAPLV
jgi:hypothetical protein